MSQLPSKIAILRIGGQRFGTTLPFAPFPIYFWNVKIGTPVEPIAPLLEKVVAGGLRRTPDAPLLAWPLACGSAVAARTRAVDCVRGVLRVEVPDPGWRAELQHLAPRYLVAIDRYAPKRVNRIEFLLREQPQK